MGTVSVSSCPRAPGAWGGWEPVAVDVVSPTTGTCRAKVANETGAPVYIYQRDLGIWLVRSYSSNQFMGR